MPYTSCSACGAKALVGATRCPRCQAPFVSYDLRGDRVPTVNCPKCGVQRPVAIGVCPNCLTSSTLPRGHIARGMALAGMVITVIIAIGYGVSRQLGRSGASGRPASSTPAIAGDSQTALDSTTANVGSGSSKRKDSTASVQIPTTVPTEVSATPAALMGGTAAARPADPTMVAQKPSRPPSVVVPDTGKWEYAIATTWVRVRSAPNRGSDVLRMIDSAQRVRLGPPMTGWRPVRVGVDRGWVDPRLFTVIPALRP